MNNWSLPSELNQTLPRLVKPSGTFISAFMLLTVMVLGMLFFGLYLSYHDSHNRAILKATGVATEAQVTNLQSHYGKHAHFDVSYLFQPEAFTNSDPSTQAATRGTSQGQLLQLHIGQNVPILYDPDNSTISDLNFNDRIHTSNPYGAMLFSLEFYGGMYAFFIPFLLFPYFKQKKLVQWGKATAATIIDEIEVQTRNARSETLTYQFKDDQGKLIQGVQKGLPSQDKLDSKGMSKLMLIKLNPVVLYDPNNSTKNMLYTSSSYVAAVNPRW